MKQKPHISVSQLGMLSRCGQQYAFRYEEGLVLPPGIAAVRGIGVHRAAAANGEQKIETHEDLPVSDVKEIASAAFDELLDDGIWLSDEELSEGKDRIVGEAKDATVSLAEFYSEEIASDYQPTHVEETFRIDLTGPRDFLGIIDLITDDKKVVDYKTSGKSKTQSEADRSLQLTAYAAGHEKLTGQPAEEVRLDVMVTAKKGVKRQVLESHRSPEDFEVLAKHVNAAVAVIEAGNYLPADPTHWCCSPKWCGFWSQCKFVRGGKRK